MNIILVNHYAGSIHHGMEFRPYYMAQEWIKSGHNVTVIAADHSHLRTTNPSNISSMNNEIIDGINYIWLKTYKYQGNGIKRVLNIFSFVFQLFRFKRKICELITPDVVIASSTYPLDILAVKSIAKSNNAKIIFEVHDLWPLSPMEIGGMSKLHPFIQLMQFSENLAYRSADSVVSMLPCAKSHMIEHGMFSDKFIHIPNGIVMSDWGSKNGGLSSLHQNVFNELKTDGYFIFGYAGGHAASNSLHTVLDAAFRLQDKKIKFVFVGDGNEKKSLELLAKQLKLSNIVFLPPVSKTLVPKLLMNFDCALILAVNSPLYRFGISPNKIFDYMMAKKPIIQAIDAGNDMISDSGCGISVAGENPKELVTACLTMFNLSLEQRDTMGLLGYKYVIDNHDYRKLANKFSNLFNSKV